MSRNTLYQLRTKGAIATAAFWLVLSGSTGSLAQSLPQPPDTGTPEEDFSAGGTRDSKQVTLCGTNAFSLAYLLGDQNRELTASAHPAFWFYIPSHAAQVQFMTLSLTELATEQNVYERTILEPRTGIIGIALPQKQQYELTANVNYRWKLKVTCAQASEPSVALEGWLMRVPLDAELQDQLATAPEHEKYQVYLQHNLLYDALNDLAQRHFANPNDSRLAAAWKQLLAEELGWQDLTQPSIVEPNYIDAGIDPTFRRLTPD